MDIKKVKRPLNLFIKNLNKNITPEQIIIFGSYSTDTARKDSDIDVLVVADIFSKMKEDERLDILYDASKFIYPEIHPWGLTQKELNNAHKQSTIGYARDHGIKFF